MITSACGWTRCWRRPAARPILWESNGCCRSIGASPWLPKHAQEIVLDLDAMGHRLHGFQEGRHFNAYYDDYCYLPLYAFAGDFPLDRKSTRLNSSHLVISYAV